jgi:hypothetical protein
MANLNFFLIKKIIVGLLPRVTGHWVKRGEGKHLFGGFCMAFPPKTWVLWVSQKRDKEHGDKPGNGLKVNRTFG